jgi:hypothetical protein
MIEVKTSPVAHRHEQRQRAARRVGQDDRDEIAATILRPKRTTVAPVERDAANGR